MTLKRNLMFVTLLVKMKLVRTMAFRFSFFAAFFADGTLFVVQLITFAVIYGQVDSIGDWGRGQMLIFIGTFSMLNGLNMVIYFFGLVSVPGKIREGALDLYITKPGNTLLRLTFEDVNLGSAPLLLLSGGIIAWGAAVEGVRLTLPLLLAYSGMVILMTLLYYDMEVIIRTIPFFVISATSIERLEGDLLMMNFKIPGVVYKGFFKILFYFALPYGVMATVPTQLLTNTLTAPGLAHALCIVAAFTVFALWFWRLGLKHYKSASS
ncbi:MAG: ABC transporter permease [Oscillospiraceae bacterium]|nr:ABC transporter permease [Oscillospiraceae bacterium]